MMKKVFKYSVVAFILSIFITAAAWLENENRYYPTHYVEDYLIGFSLSFFISAFTITLLMLAITYHKKILNKGWQRFLILAYIALMPVGIYIDEKLFYPNSLLEYVLNITMVCSLTYIVIIGLYVLFAWVKSGFNEQTP